MSGSVNWTNRQVEERGGSERPHKYNARKKEVDGILFDSTREAKRYQELRWMERVGDIGTLSLQRRWTLQESFTDSAGKKHRAIEYMSDFDYLIWEGIPTPTHVVEDVKGCKTPTYRLKAKLFRAKYPHVRFIET